MGARRASKSAKGSLADTACGRADAAASRSANGSASLARRQPMARAVPPISHDSEMDADMAAQAFDL